MNQKIYDLLSTACSKREPLAEITNATRLVNSTGDSLPGIVVEQYNKHFVIHNFEGRNTELLPTVTNFLQLKYDPDYLILKHRHVEGGKAHDEDNVKVLIEKGGSKTVVTENGFQFEVDLNDTLNSGLFLDMRKNRQIVSTLCSGKELLNCFAYTSSFGVYARKCGASRVTNVDVSAKILERGKKNYALNQIDLLGNDFMLADTMLFLKGAIKRENHFDIIILDPPTFGRHKGKIFSITQSLDELITLALSILKPGGHLLLATNCSTIPYTALKSALLNNAKLSHRIVQSIQPLSQDVDFPGTGNMKESFLSCILAHFQ